MSKYFSCCDKCGCDISLGGGILISPTDGRKADIYEVCGDCWKRIIKQVNFEFRHYDGDFK